MTYDLTDNSGVPVWEQQPYNVATYTCPGCGQWVFDFSAMPSSTLICYTCGYVIRQGDDIQYERVNHPDHYNKHPSGVECIDIIEHMQYNIGAAMKYLWRAGLKPNVSFVEDLRKAVWYIEREIGRLENEGNIS